MNFHLVVIFQSIKYIKDLPLFIKTKNNYLIVDCLNCFICLVFLKMAKKLNKNELTSLSSKSKVQCSEPKSDVKSMTKKKKMNRYCSMCSNHSVFVVFKASLYQSENTKEIVILAVWAIKYVIDKRRNCFCLKILSFSKDIV